MDNVSYKAKDMKESLAPATMIERPGDVMFRAPDPEVLDVKPRRNFTISRQNTNFESLTKPIDAASPASWVPCFAVKGFIHPT